ncbi:hypothetical protein VCHA53O466_40426 [Vibrio chagasii]|nr:hypothetical protein VCHA53O466_40426 [Vibrio chagasii]
MSTKLYDYITNDKNATIINESKTNDTTTINLRYKGVAIDQEEEHDITVSFNKKTAAIEVDVDGEDTIIEFDGTVNGYSSCLVELQLHANVSKTANERSVIIDNTKNAILAVEMAKNKCTAPALKPSEALINACKKN